VRTAFEFIEKIEQQASVAAIVNTIDSAMRKHGVEHCLFSFVALPTETLNDVTLASRIPTELQKVYDERDYVHDDPGFRYAQQTIQPFRWFEDSPYDPQVEPRAQDVVDLCRDFGLVHGIVIPFASRARRLGQVWFGGSQKPDLAEVTWPRLHLMSLYAFDRVLRVTNDNADAGAISLTRRERDVLTLVALGKSTEQIAEKFAITQRTVVEHLNQSRRKLGATTRAHAVMIAMRQRMIQP
jgi:LuxR family transcriptional regulator, quorum-sensing system regulator BjaR1